LTVQHWLHRVWRSGVNRVSHITGRLHPQWSPDVAWRYLPIARIVRAVVGERGSVLDVGAGGRGIGAYLPNRCVLTDYIRPVGPGPRFVLADAALLPFSDLSFDAVVQADVMEHVPPEKRPVVARELFRVARRLVVVAAPAGAAAEAHDRRLAAAAHPSNHLRHFLQEHFDYGLPTREELLRLVLEGAQGSFVQPRVRVERNANLFLRYLVMRSLVRVEDEDVAARIRVWTPFSRVLASIRMGECYRLIVSCENGC